MKMYSKTGMLLLTCISIFVSCKKSSPGTGNANPLPVNTDVYVTGSEMNAAGIMVAKLWKNGTAYDVSDGTKNAGASGVFVRGTEVYVSFSEGSSRPRAKLWKNGIVSTLYFADMNSAFAESQASGMCNGVVSGWCTTGGGGRFVAVYWDDSGVHEISNAATDNASASAIHIKTINNFTRTSLCGQIDAANTLASKRAFSFGGQFSNPSMSIIGGTQLSSMGRTCFINDNGFTYTGGSEAQPKIWFENGAAITPSTNVGSVNGIYVVGNTNLYAVGEELVNGKHIAKLWSGDYLSGNLQATNLSNTQYEATASAIQVVDGNTFIAGNEFESDGKVYAKYWKNGIAVKVGGPTSYTSAIYVVKK